jgi:hypothetical protein
LGPHLSKSIEEHGIRLSLSLAVGGAFFFSSSVRVRHMVAVVPVSL